MPFKRQAEPVKEAEAKKPPGEGVVLVEDVQWKECYKTVCVCVDERHVQ